MNQLRIKKKSRVLQSIGAVLLVAGFYLVTTAGAPRQAAPQLAEVKFQPMVSPLYNDNPDWAGGGQRIFPDKDWYTEESDRTKVKVVAKVDGAGKGIPVYFRVFDVDDPSTDDFPADLNGSAGGDNRGTYDAGTPKYTNPRWDRTDDGGIAEAVLSVTKKPGDNFVVAASLDEGYLNGIHDAPIAGNPARLVDANGAPLPTANGVQTGLLTVWRRLHIEIDSMSVVQDNFVAGFVTSTKAVPGGTEVVLDKTLESDRFHGGRIVIGGVGGGDFVVIGNNRTTVSITGDASDTVGQTYVLWDDDDFNSNDGVNVHGDNGEDITRPDEADPPDVYPWLLKNSDDRDKNVFARANVLPVYILDNPHPEAPFVLNWLSYAADYQVNRYAFDNISQESNKDFWTVYLLGAYQPKRADDSDPNTESGWYGKVDRLNGVGAVVWLETLAEASKTAVVNVPASAAHEIGHLFGARHVGDGSLMAQSWARKSVKLGPDSIDAIRWAVHP